MKNIIVLFALLLLVQTTKAQIWSHVGPTKSNASGAYENGRIDAIVTHPNYDGTTNQKIFASSIHGGLWATIDDGANWTNISTTSLKFSGVSDIAVDATGTGYLYVSDVNSLNYHIRQSSNVYKYSIGPGTWLPQAPFPTPAGVTLKINHLKIHPGNSQIVFACANAGIFRTTNGGASWALVEGSAEFENIVFVPTTAGNFDAYASGRDKFMVSTNNGASFSNVFATNPFPNYDHVYLDLGYAFDNTNNGHIIYLAGTAEKSTGITPTYGGTGKICFILYKFTKSAAGVTNIQEIFTYRDTDPNNDRLLCYGNKDVVYVGGDGLRKYNFITNKFYNAGSNTESIIPVGSGPSYWEIIHPDLHDLKIIEIGGVHRVLAATDGGFYLNNFTANAQAVYTNSWSEKNNNMDISQIWGFSSSETEPNFYSTGEADTKGFTFNASNMASCRNSPTIEPISTLIDNFDANNVFFNFSQGAADAKISINHGVSYPYSSQYYGVQPGNTFVPNTTVIASHGLRTNHFYQDINRPGKIYMGGGGLWQYSSVTHSFGCKYRTGMFFTTGPNPLLKDTWGTDINGIAISPTNENKFYMVGLNTLTTAAQVYQFTGPNINDSWLNYNENSWSLTTPDLKAIISPTLSDNDIYQVSFPTIAVSDWNPDKIWIGLSRVPGFPNAKVLKRENGTWTDYSSGIASDEEVISMVYERGSNDGIYLGTNRNVYYRNSSSANWSPYSTDLPHLFMVQLNINYKENTLRAGTFGRGIWKTNLNCPVGPFVQSNCNNCNGPVFFWEGSTVSVSSTTLNTNKLIMRATDYVEILPGSSYTLLDATNNPNTYYQAFIHGCK